MSMLRAYLQLMRFPAVFTALCDILLGFLLNHSTLAGEERKFSLLLVASAGLYLSGMVFNDLFDRAIDARERPGRPIPSGRVSARAALILAILLMAAGIAAAALVGTQSLGLALAIAGAIFLYNGFLKKTPLGPLGMGLCRFLNVMLGASGHSLALAVWSRFQWQAALAMGVYIVGVTWFARNEAGENRRAPLVGATAVVNAGIAGLAAYAASYHAGSRSIQSVLISLALMAFIKNRRRFATVLTPTPERVQTSVKMLIYSYVLLEATLIFSKTQNPALAIAAAALLAPAMLLGRWIYIT